MSLPPMTSPATAPGTPFLSRTPDIILVTAIEHKGVVGDGFQMVAFPAASDNARFLRTSPPKHEQKIEKETYQP